MVKNSYVPKTSGQLLPNFISKSDNNNSCFKGKREVAYKSIALMWPLQDIGDFSISRSW